MSMPNEVPETIDLSSMNETVPSVIEKIDLGPIAPPQFEFSPEQNELFADLAQKMGIVGLFLIAVGVVSPLLQLVAQGQLRFDFSYIVYIVMGILTRSAASGFRQVVDTKGKDITHLIEALESLRWFYRVIYWLLVIALAVLVIVAVAAALGSSVALRRFL
jgi:hypothetical protein